MADDTPTVEQALAELDAAVDLIELSQHTSGYRYEAAKTALIAAVRAEKDATDSRCRDYKPDHNGECLNCDDWLAVHPLDVQLAVADRVVDALRVRVIELEEQIAAVRAENAAEVERLNAILEQVALLLRPRPS